MNRKENLYDPRFEHDACGIGAVVSIDGRKSHDTVDDALRIVEKLEHRAGKDATGETGDGVGILLQIPHAFFQRATAECGITLGEAGSYGVGMFFFPQDRLRTSQARKMVEIIAEKEGVPVKPDPSVVFGILSKTNCLKNEVLYVGDSGVDMETARRAGVDSAGVTWGFRSVAELRAAYATHIVDSPAEILQIIDNEK